MLLTHFIKKYHPIFHEAATQNNIRTIRIFIALAKIGANLDIRNQNGNTALHLAARRGRTNIVEALIRADANLNIQNRHGDTALHLAVMQYEITQFEIATVRALVRAGANPNIRNHDGNTPLHLAAQQGCMGSVLVLVSATGIDLNIRNHNDNTALHLALQQHGYIATVTGAGTGTGTGTGTIRPVFLSDIAKAWVSSGANLVLRDTPLRIAYDYSNNIVAHFLLLCDAEIPPENERRGALYTFAETHEISPQRNAKLHREQLFLMSYAIFDTLDKKTLCEQHESARNQAIDTCVQALTDEHYQACLPTLYFSLETCRVILAARIRRGFNPENSKTDLLRELKTTLGSITIKDVFELVIDFVLDYTEANRRSTQQSLLAQTQNLTDAFYNTYLLHYEQSIATHQRQDISTRAQPSLIRAQPPAAAR